MKAFHKIDSMKLALRQYRNEELPSELQLDVAAIHNEVNIPN